MNSARALPVLLATACFSEADVGGTVTETGSSGSTVASAESGVDASTSGGTGATTPAETTTGSADGPGPQLVASVPADGDVQASLIPVVELRFDRPVSLEESAGRILARVNGGTPVPVIAEPCLPDDDPACIRALVPMELHDPATPDRLRGGTPHEIVVAADFPDLDGNVNTMDQSVAFTTFEYERIWVDDSNAIADEVGAVAYEPAIAALFVIGPDIDGIDTIVRRIRLDDDAAQLPTTAGRIVAPPGGPFVYGTYTVMDELWLPMAHAGDIRRLNHLDDPMLTEVTFGGSTLMPPYDVLQDVWSIGRTPTRLLMSFGDIVGDSDRFGIIELTAGTWSVFEDGTDLWGENTCVITNGLVDGAEHLFALADRQIFDFTLADDTLAGAFALPDAIPTDDASLVLDASGRLWLGSSGGLWVFDAGAGELPLLAERVGVRAGRFAVREAGETVHAYYVDFRGPAVIGHVAIAF